LAQLLLHASVYLHKQRCVEPSLYSLRTKTVIWILDCELTNHRFLKIPAFECVAQVLNALSSKGRMKRHGPNVKTNPPVTKLVYSFGEVCCPVSNFNDYAYSFVVSGKTFAKIGRKHYKR